MSDAYGYGGGAPRDSIVQALMNVQNPPPGGVTQTGAPLGPTLPLPGGVAGAGSTPTPYAAPPGAVGSPNIAPGGIGQPPLVPQIPGAPAGYSSGLYNPQMGQQAPSPLVPNISQQLPPGGLPRY